MGTGWHCAVPFFVDIVSGAAYNEATKRVHDPAADGNASYEGTERDMGKNRQKNRDRVILSSVARKQSKLETLLRQREELAERKREQADIGPQKDALPYHVQLAALDESIAQAEAEQEIEEDAGIYARPKTSEQQADEDKAKWRMDVAAVHDQAYAMLSLRAEMLEQEGNRLPSRLEIEQHTAVLGSAMEETTALRMAAMQLTQHAMEVLRSLADSAPEKESPSEKAGETEKNDDN